MAVVVGCVKRDDGDCGCGPPETVRSASLHDSYAMTPLPEKFCTNSNIDYTVGLRVQQFPAFKGYFEFVFESFEFVGDSGDFFSGSLVKLRVRHPRM